MGEFGSNNPIPYPHASKNVQILFDIWIADKILGKVMKGIVCQTFSFCTIRVNVRMGVDSTSPPLLGLTLFLAGLKNIKNRQGQFDPPLYVYVPGAQTACRMHLQYLFIYEGYNSEDISPTIETIYPY